MADYLKPACAIFLPATGVFLSGRLVHKELKAWNKKFKPPSFAPPDWVFPPAMLTTYCFMGYGSYLVWKDCGGFQGDGVLPLTCYAANLALSWTQPLLVCKTKSLGVGVISMLLVIGTRTATFVTFKNVNSTAAYLVLPALGLVGLATFTSFSRWRNNRANRD